VNPGNLFGRGRITKRKMMGCLDRQHKTHIGGTFQEVEEIIEIVVGCSRVFEKKRKKSG
jgi:hypothetical protein